MARGTTTASLALALATSVALTACWGVDYQKVDGAAGAAGQGGGARGAPS